MDSFDLPVGVRDVRAVAAAEGSEPDEGELLYLAHELSRLISTVFDRSMAPHRITHAQWWAVMHVSQHEGATQSELANIMQMGRASTGKLIERLEREGWVERRDDPEDKRVQRVFLGQNVAPYMALTHEKAILLYDALLGNIAKEEQAALLHGLRKIKANAERAVRIENGHENGAAPIGG